MPKGKTSGGPRAGSKDDLTVVDEPTIIEEEEEDRPGGWGGNPVMDAALEKNTSDIAAVGTSLTNSGSLYDVANGLGLFTPAKAPTYDTKDEKRLLQSLAGSAQEAAVLTAARDAIKANRPIKYVCGIKTPALVREIHFHISATATETVIEIVAGPAHP
jgi:hypothetical protein